MQHRHYGFDIILSLPSWERGLKFPLRLFPAYAPPSLPSWECGLKSECPVKGPRRLQSLPSWERGLKCHNGVYAVDRAVVAPLVGAWIEICYCLR